MRPTLTLSLLFFCACGSGSTNSPSGTVPASIVVQSGNNQQAPSRNHVATAPAVLVKDADGNAIENVTVQFTITTGGGSIAGAVPKTDASGVARVGSWTLGNAGAQRLSAKVANLDPVFFDATVTPGTETTLATIPSTGGTLEITTPGHQYLGTKLTIPAGSFPAAKEWIFWVDPDLTLPHVPSGFTVLGPALMVETDALRSNKLMTLTMPVPSGSKAFLVFYDPVRRVVEVMPTVARTPTSITVMTGHLNPTLLLGPDPTGSGVGNIAAPGGGIYVVGMPTFYPLLPSFAPGTLGWSLPDAPTAAFPNGHGAAIPIMNAIMSNISNATAGLIKGSIPSNYHTDLATFAAREVAAKTLAAATQDPLGEYLAALVPVPKAERDLWTAGQMNMYLGLSGLPIPVGLFTGPQAQYQQGAFATATATTPTSIQFVNAADNSTTDLALTALGFVDPQVRTLPGGTPFTATVAVPLSSFIAPHEAIKDLMRNVLTALQSNFQTGSTIGRSIANTALLPVGAFEYQATPDGPWIPGDGLLVFRNTTGKLRPVINGVPQPMLVIDPKTFVESFRTGGEPINYSTLPNFNDNGTQRVMNTLIRPGPGGARPALSVSNGVFGQFAAQQGPTTGEQQLLPMSIEFAKELFIISPDQITITAADRKADFTASVGRPPVEGFRIKWEWGDGTTPTDNLGITTASHTYTSANNYQVIATLTMNNAARTVLAVDTAEIKGDPMPFWRVLTLSDPDGFLPGIHSSGEEMFQALERVIQNPTAGLISIEQSGELALRTKQAGVWSANDCCPLPGYNPATEWKLSLGFSPAVSHPVGPFFAGWGTSFWSQSTQALDSGTLTGQYVPRVMQYQIHDQGTQTGPAGGFRFSATRNGDMMIGEITIHIWLVDVSGTGEVSGTKVFHLPFTAVRIR